MARPLDAAKRKAILNSAIHCIKLHGLHATTTAIAKEANVSTGTLFTYFPDKCALLNCLLLELKSEIAASVMHEFPFNKSIKEKAFHTWQSYVAWSCRYPDRRCCAQQLMVSCFILDITHKAVQEKMKSINDVLKELQASHSCSSVEFITAVMSSLAETTIDFILNEPAREKHYIEMGFYMFWQAVRMPEQRD